ncbi:hypothetical protein [Bdellovibrio sp. HCB337]|uniref:hypothetical protein n=1 Tax=Bdellovibrio sp. HCB337 TaxID=3394358 RepID=UPI0039A780BF
MAAEESVTNYFSYVKNVLGVKTLQSARIRQSLQEEIKTDSCDLLFLNLKQAADLSVFAKESADLLDKMIQAMRLGGRRHLIMEHDLTAAPLSLNQILQQYSQKVSTPFVVVFSTKPSSNNLQNLGSMKFIESFGPSYLLQNPNTKKLAWADLQKVMKELGVL